MDQIDKIKCFAWISPTKCNALSCKNCSNCSFFKDRKDVPNYDKYIDKKEIAEREVNICQLAKKLNS